MSNLIFFYNRVRKIGGIKETRSLVVTDGKNDMDCCISDLV